MTMEYRSSGIGLEDVFRDQTLGIDLWSVSKNNMGSFDLGAALGY